MLLSGQFEPCSRYSGVSSVCVCECEGMCVCTCVCVSVRVHYLIVLEDRLVTPVQLVALANDGAYDVRTVMMEVKIL